MSDAGEHTSFRDEARAELVGMFSQRSGSIPAEFLAEHVLGDLREGGLAPTPGRGTRSPPADGQDRPRLHPPASRAPRSRSWTRVAVRFLSVEPLLEDLGEVDPTGIDWVIVGGESGPGARPMKKEWSSRSAISATPQDPPKPKTFEP